MPSVLGCKILRQFSGSYHDDKSARFRFCDLKFGGIKKMQEGEEASFLSSATRTKKASIDGWVKGFEVEVGKDPSG